MDLIRPSTSDIFLLTPLREGRQWIPLILKKHREISTHAPAGGATSGSSLCACLCSNFYSRPCGRGDVPSRPSAPAGPYFYSRPCGRGDVRAAHASVNGIDISTHAPAGGATSSAFTRFFALRNFYSRPCGRGDSAGISSSSASPQFLLTPLREGRPRQNALHAAIFPISTHAPAGGATF